MNSKSAPRADARLNARWLWALPAVLAVTVCLARLGEHVFDSYNLVTIPQRSGPLVGDFLPAPPNYNWRTYDATLVLALRVDCPFCEVSMPFYRKLVARDLPPRVHLLAVLSSDAGSTRQYLVSRHLRIDFRGAFQAATPALGQTPTLLLVNRDGRIEYYWIGVQGAQEQEAIVDMLEKYAR